MNISLDGDDFRKLVSGEIVKIEDASISLQDIGFDEMMNTISEVRDDFDASQEVDEPEENEGEDL